MPTITTALTTPSIRIIEGWTRVLGIPLGWIDRAKSGAIEIYNAPRPFPCHDDAQGEYVHGIFYGIIDPGLERADEYRQGAIDLDAHRLAFVTKEEVETWGRAYCKKYRVEYEDYLFADIAKSFLRHSDKG